MTNENIILNESVKLMNEGKLKGSGVFVTVQTANGATERMELPEPIHTFNGWKAIGYKVKKGEKSNIKFPIWKAAERHVERTDSIESTDEAETITRMFMKVSAFFYGRPGRTRDRSCVRYSLILLPSLGGGRRE